MTARYYLNEPRSWFFGWVLSKRTREVSRKTYEEYARAHGWTGIDIVADEFAWECRRGTDGWVEE